MYDYSKKFHNINKEDHGEALFLKGYLVTQLCTSGKQSSKAIEGNLQPSERVLLLCKQ